MRAVVFPEHGAPSVLVQADVETPTPARHLHMVMPLAEARRGHEMLEAGEVAGKIVLSVP